MMRFLILDISDHDLFLRRSNCECTVAFLPTKLVDLMARIVHMFGTRCLKLAKQIGNAMGWRQFDEQMHMVYPTSNTNGDTIKTTYGTT